MHNVKTLLVAIFCLTGLGPAYATNTITIENAWSPEAPPVVKVMAGYMVIKNTGKNDVKILSAKSPLFSKVEIHRTEMKNGMAKMVKQEKLLIAAGQKIELKPNGLHMMLMGKLKPVTKGMHIPVSITFDNGETINTRLKVKTDRVPQMKCGQGKCGSM